jgi:hypothetical protein
VDNEVAVLTKYGFCRSFPTWVAIVVFIWYKFDIDNAEMPAVVQDFTNPFSV